MARLRAPGSEKSNWMPPSISSEVCAEAVVPRTRPDEIASTAAARPFIAPPCPSGYGQAIPFSVGRAREASAPPHRRQRADLREPRSEPGEHARPGVPLLDQGTRATGETEADLRSQDADHGVRQERVALRYQG